MKVKALTLGERKRPELMLKSKLFLDHLNSTNTDLIKQLNLIKRLNT